MHWEQFGFQCLAQGHRQGREEQAPIRNFALCTEVTKITTDRCLWLVVDCFSWLRSSDTSRLYAVRCLTVGPVCDHYYSYWTTLLSQQPLLVVYKAKFLDM